MHKGGSDYDQQLLICDAVHARYAERKFIREHGDAGAEAPWPCTYRRRLGQRVLHVRVSEKSNLIIDTNPDTLRKNNYMTSLQLILEFSIAKIALLGKSQNLRGMCMALMVLRSV